MKCIKCEDGVADFVWPEIFCAPTIMCTNCFYERFGERLLLESQIYEISKKFSKCEFINKKPQSGIQKSLTFREGMRGYEIVSCDTFYIEERKILQMCREALKYYNYLSFRKPVPLRGNLFALGMTMGTGAPSVSIDIYQEKINDEDWEHLTQFYSFSENEDES